MFYRLMGMTALLACVAAAQSDYQGPSIISRGADGIGNRGGQQVDLRFFAGVNAIYDTGLLPLTTDTSGHLVDPGGQPGVEANIGAYGSHAWRTSLLGLDYKGDYRHYASASSLDGSDQQLTLGYTYQKSRRLKFDFREMAGTFSQGFGQTVSPIVTDTSAIITPGTGLLFDNRTTFLQTGMDVTYVMSARNSFTVGGEGYDVLRQSSALVGMHGYTLHGTFEHRVSKETAVSATYDHYHYDFPSAFGETTADSIELGYATTFDRRKWTFKISGGALQAETEGLQTVELDPLVASILGISTTVQTYYQKTIIPSGSASLMRQFKSSNLSFNYSRGISPGDGVYLTSIQENAGATYTYTGVRKVSLSASGYYNRFSSLGQSLAPYKGFGGSGAFSYAMTRAFHLIARYDSRRQDINATSFAQQSYRVTLGVTFSPGDIPLSLW